MKAVLVDLILKRLNESKIALQAQFHQSHPIAISRYFTLDNLLPESLAQAIYDQFPKSHNMKNLKGFGRIKLKYGHLKDMPALLKDINAAIQDPRVVTAIGEITGIQQQVPDPSRFAGGVSRLEKGYYLNPHIDISHNAEHKAYYRTANVLYYVSPNWCLEKGGNYEIWDKTVEQCLVIPALFNRLLVMETNQFSWHAVSKVTADEPRCCIFNYYFSTQSPDQKAYSKTVASFKARPEQKLYRSLQAVKDKLKSLIF